MLRDVKDTTISTLATEVLFLPLYALQYPVKNSDVFLSNERIYLYCEQVTGKLAALKGLDARLKEIRSYLDLVIEGKLPLNHEILYHLQV